MSLTEQICLSQTKNNMKLQDLLSGREKLRKYDDLVSELHDLHFGHLAIEDGYNYEKLMAVEKAKAKRVAEIESEIAKLDEE